MAQRRAIMFAMVAASLSFVPLILAQDRPQSVRPSPDVRLLPPMDVAPAVPMLRQQADELRTRSREAQELADRLRRQADELDMAAHRLMNRARNPEAMGPEPSQGPFQPMPPGSEMAERQKIKRQIEGLRDEAQRAKEQGRAEDAKRIIEKAERLEQKLRSWGPPAPERSGREMPPEVQDILRAAEQAEREGRLDEARRQRLKAEDVARQLQEQRGEPGGEERPRMKERVGRLREEAKRAKEQGRTEDSERLWRDADRLEQQLREQAPPDVKRQEIKHKIERLRDESRIAKEQNRREEAERLWREADRLEQRLREPGPQGKGESVPQFMEEIMRSIQGLKQEIARLWQAVNEIRSRPEDHRS